MIWFLAFRSSRNQSHSRPFNLLSFFLFLSLSIFLPLSFCWVILHIFRSRSCHSPYRRLRLVSSSRHFIASPPPLFSHLRHFSALSFLHPPVMRWSVLIRRRRSCDSESNCVRLEKGGGLVALSLSLARSEPRPLPAPLASYFFAPFFYFALCEKFLLRRTTFLIAKMLNSRFVLIQYFLNYSS